MAWALVALLILVAIVVPWIHFRNEARLDPERDIAEALRQSRALRNK
jgi:hypothetical protein